MTGRVVGLDLNVGRLEVVRGIAASAEMGPDDPEPAVIEWLEASAEAMPLAARSFDVVIASQAIEFPGDPAAVASELRRVLRPGARLAVSGWRAPEASPLFAAEIAMVSERLGADAAGGLIAAFDMADPSRFVDALGDAGFEAVEPGRLDLLLDLPPLADWAPRHLAGTTVARAIANAGPGIARELGADIAQALSGYVTPDGVRVPFSSWLVEARAPGI